MRNFFLTPFLSLWSMVALATLALAPTSYAAAPVIGGVDPTDLAINDNNSGALVFPNVTLTDSDTALLAVTIQISPAARGSLKTESYIVNNGGGNYTLTASNTSQLVDRLNDVRFIPTANLLVPPTVYSATVGLTVSDGTSSDTASRSVEITSVNDTPTVTPASLQTIGDNQTNATIFSSVSFGDADTGQQASVKVTFNSLKGSFANPGGSAFTLSGPDNAKILTLPTQGFAAAQTALRALAFTPEENQVKVGQFETLAFAIAVSDGTATGNGTQNVRVNSINDAPVIDPTTARNFTISAGSTATPYGDITVTDADVDTPSDPGSIGGGSGATGDTFTATIVLSPKIGRAHV